MKRYSAVIGFKALHTDDVNEAFEFAFKPLEDSGTEMVVPIPALKTHMKGELIADGRKALSVSTQTRGTLTFVITDNLWPVAQIARKAAKALYACDGELEFDATQPINRTEAGWKVECWVWVDAESAGCEDLDEETDEDNVESAYIAAAEHRSVEFKDSRASLGDEPGAYVSGWVTVSDADVLQYDLQHCAKRLAP